MNIKSTPQDDENFCQLVESIVNGFVRDYNPKMVTLIHIDNWFDHKWLNFSGQAEGDLGLWKEKLTIPPFHPNRIVSQTMYHQDENGGYEETEAPPLHVSRRSSDNLHNRLAGRFNSGILVWWSGQSVVNKRGSLMVYVITAEEAWSCFMSMDGKEEWTVSRTKDVPMETVEKYIENSA